MIKRLLREQIEDRINNSINKHYTGKTIDSDMFEGQYVIRGVAFVNGVLHIIFGFKGSHKTRMSHIVRKHSTADYRSLDDLRMELEERYGIRSFEGVTNGRLDHLISTK